MIVNLMPEIIAGAIGSIAWHDAVHLLVVKSHLNTVILGQSYEIFTNFQKAWNNFVSTGQIGAFFIGIFVGWFFKGIFP
ncbi:hypothetical protein IQ270_19645 [Microcoleus sp. LEGE 07076]|uniref:hypothetical protein n=1 Tax=Microcoleus sp. LEGE 07076 TaxID=915322 RepID=UPI00187EA101|nr:hypothetical protein [Microcoleus sp. LEGE 07076]MBE9186808.1 hypothetical protein [Microcoleus sp. LEGE 07076]